LIWLLQRAALLGLAAAAGLTAQALLGLAPVHAEPLVDVRASWLPLPLLVFALAAALGPAIRRRPGPWRGLLAAFSAVSAALAIVTWSRAPRGLTTRVENAAGARGALLPGPIDLIGDDLEQLPPSRKWLVSWDGPLHAPRAGAYTLRARGRGRVQVRLDGHLVLTGEGESFDVQRALALPLGPRRLEVRYERTGPGARLRLLWVPPARDGRPGRSESLILPRYLGPQDAAWTWRLTDALAWLACGLAAAFVWAAPWPSRGRLRAPRPVGRGELCAAAAGYALLVAAMSWPLVTAPASLGVVNRPDGRLNCWILAWDAHALLHAPGRAFQAPIFHPLPDALAFSENLLLPAAAAAPLTFAFGPVFGYNLLLLGSAALSGIGTMLLARRFSGDALAAFVAGALFAAGVHRWVNLAHLHAHLTLFLPPLLLALDRFWQTRSRRAALAAGLLLALQGASSVYLGAIAATLVGTLALLGMFSQRRKGAARLLAGLALAAALLFPLARPYLRMRVFQGEEFTLATVANYATTPESYLASASPLHAEITRRELDPDRVRDPLFPGVVPLLLGVVGLAAAPRRVAVYAVAASLLAFLISLGPETALYRFLHEHVLLFRGIRALSRFSVIPVLALSLLSGLALAGRSRAVVAAWLLLALLESNQAPIAYGRYAGPSPAARALAASAGGIVSLPLGEDDTSAMLEAAAHFRPLLNGDSGFMPRPYARAMELLQGPLAQPALSFLRAVGVREVLSRFEQPLPLVRRHPPGFLYAVPTGESARAVEPAAAPAQIWSAAGALIDLGAERACRRVVFELNDAPWVARPRLRVSSDGQAWREIDASADLAAATLSLYRDPRRGRGEMRFAETAARFLWLDPRLPARPGTLGLD
jgi:hypothetical protein